MTVSNTANRMAYAGNGSTTVFATPPFISNSNIYAYLVDNATFVVTNQALTTHFTLAGAGTGADGSLTMLTPPPTGKTLVVSRIMPLTQSTDYVNADAFPADSHELALDKLTFITQQIATRQSRSMTLPDSDTSGVDLTLPRPFAGMTMQVNSGGTAVEWVTPTAASIADGSIGTAKLGGNITTFSKTLLIAATSTAWLSGLGFTALGKDLIAVVNAAALRALAGVGAIGDDLFTATTTAAARTALGVSSLGSTLMSVADAAAIRTAAGITSAGSTIVTTATSNGASFVAAANYAAQKVLWGVTAFGDSVMMAADAAASRVLHGFTTIGSDIVTAADAAAVRSLLSVATEIPAGGVVQTVFSNTASVNLRIQGVTNKVLVRAVIGYSGLTTGTVYLTASDEGGPSSTLHTLNLDSVSDDVNTATIEWEYTPSLVALHNITYGVAVTGVTLVAQTISAIEIVGGFSGTPLPWSPASLVGTSHFYKGGLSPMTTAVSRGGSVSGNTDNVKCFFDRQTSSPVDLEDTTALGNPTASTADATYTKVLYLTSGQALCTTAAARAGTGEFAFTFGARVSFSSDTFVGPLVVNAGNVTDGGDSGSLHRGFAIRDNGIIDFGYNASGANYGTYDATTLDWTLWHSIIVRYNASGEYNLYVDGSFAAQVTGTSTASNDKFLSINGSTNARVVSVFVYSADSGTGADLTSLNTWLALPE